MYNKILVPMALDHGVSEYTLGVAKALSSPGAEIIALHVYEEPRTSVSAFLDKKIMREEYEGAHQTLLDKTKGLKNVTTRIVIGHTYRTIIEYAVECKVDCIVIGSHKPGLSDYLLGSTAARVVRHAPCAVHVYRSS